MRARSFKLRHQHDAFFTYGKLVQLGNVRRLWQKDDPYNPPRPMFTVVSIFADEEKCIFLDDWPACGNRQDKKRNATAKQMRGATGLTVLG